MFYSFEVRTVSGCLMQHLKAHPDPARVMRKALHAADTLEEKALIFLQTVSSTGQRHTVSTRLFFPSTMTAREIRHAFGDSISFIDNQYDPEWCPPYASFVRDTLYGYTARVMCLPDRAERGPLLDMIADAATLYPTALKEV